MGIELPKSSVADILGNAKRLLQILGDQPKRRTEWTLAAREKEISTNQFNHLLVGLLELGWVKKLSWGVYKRTESGKIYAEL